MRPRYKITRRKVVYWNKTRELNCSECDGDLVNTWVISSPSSKNRCRECAENHNILDNGARDFMRGYVGPQPLGVHSIVREEEV